jgi:hypothetical protein
VESTIRLRLPRAGLRALVERLNVVDRADRKDCFSDVILNSAILEPSPR